MHARTTGRMKGLAFALDPDRYWVEIVKRSPVCSTPFESNSHELFYFSDFTLPSNFTFLPFAILKYSTRRTNTMQKSSPTFLRRCFASRIQPNPLPSTESESLRVVDVRIALPMRVFTLFDGLVCVVAISFFGMTVLRDVHLGVVSMSFFCLKLRIHRSPASPIDVCLLNRIVVGNRLGIQPLLPCNTVRRRKGSSPMTLSLLTGLLFPLLF